MLNLYYLSSVINVKIVLFDTTFSRLNHEFGLTKLSYELSGYRHCR